MRWSFIICLLLVSSVLAELRPKRSLGYIKSLFVNKLFGSQKVVIAQPILANNETYQLFNIPGYSDIIIKVTKENKTKPNKDEPDDPVIVKPEMAIIGSYLGTPTQKETQLAIEMVKSLLQSGILIGAQDKLIQELLVPVIPQAPRFEYFEDRKLPVQPPTFAQEQGHVFLPTGNIQRVDNRNAFPVYPVEYPIATPEVKLTPVQSIYSYTQKGPEADMTYESYNNKDVIVTRTEKEPPLPKFIKLRIAEVAAIGANPYGIRQPLRMNAAPVPVPYYVNPGMIVPENTQEPNILPYISHRIPAPLRNGVVKHEYNGYGGPIIVDKNPILLSEPLPMRAVGSPYYFENNMQQVIRCKERIDVKTCPYENVQVKINNGNNIASKILNKPKQSQGNGISYNEATNANEGKVNAYRISVNEFLKNHSVNGQLVSQYVYKQMNHHSRDNYTEVRVGENPQLVKDIAGGTGNLYKNYVFIPPRDGGSPPSVLSLNNEANTGNGQDSDKNAFISKIKSSDGKYYVPSLKSNVNWNKESDFNLHPIVVSELFTEKGEQSKTNKDDFDAKRGDIPDATY